MNKENKKETVLTVDELQQLGDKLTDIMRTLEVMEHSIDLIPHARKLTDDNARLMYHSVYKLNSSFFAKIQDLTRDIDSVAFVLLENAEQEEIDRQREKGRL